MGTLHVYRTRLLDAVVQMSLSSPSCDQMNTKLRPRSERVF